MLTLVTCFPFDAVVPGGTLRYLVFAEAETDERKQTPSPPNGWFRAMP
jgi:hypothetical protein